MFPNVRLMIAASLASVVALMCGFGTFAAFQVSHEPLVRPPSASVPPLLSANNAATTPMAYAAPAPFDRRFQIGEAKNAAEAVDAFARRIDHRESIRSALSPAPEPGATEVKDMATVEALKDITPAPVAPPSDMQSEMTAAPAAGDRVSAISAPQPTPEAAAIAAAPAASPDGAKPEPAVSAVAPPPNVALVEPPAEQPLPQKQLKPENEAAPVGVTNSLDAEKTDTAAVKKTRPSHAATKTRHRQQASSAVVQSSTYPDPTVRQANFRTVPQSQQPQLPQERPARVRHAKIASRKTKEPSSATGGPLVGAPSQ
jgi:hypothetical protein